MTQSTIEQLEQGAAEIEASLPTLDPDLAQQLAGLAVQARELAAVLRQRQAQKTVRQVKVYTRRVCQQRDLDQ